ncbi:Maf family protein [Phaeodactylibacter xiamenensis]|jgi:septum formation protein|uniref:Maf family protein n=1 Tax=Phaeodactylibacter xiamenensis TaxID=1524460 RepID=UPI003CCBC9B7
MQTLELPIILVSKSPRRRQLLEQAGFPFTIKPQDVPEDYPDEMPVEEVAPFLAQKKVRASMHALEGNGVLLGADSVVILDGVIYEKPKDRADAQRILRELSGREHTVITGVCLANAKQERVFSGVSRVHFDKLSDEEIDFYIDKYQPYDKAGAYAIQEWIGLCKINKIEGTYANIMGLPVDLVYQELQHFL